MIELIKHFFYLTATLLMLLFSIFVVWVVIIVLGIGIIFCAARDMIKRLVRWVE